ncbi:MAG: hypothetical protein LBG11_04970 [Bifidobacteriaceae bacterium]|nr:hypothetical protein [Bifidobacteriaceae bacterium]
MTQAEPRTPAMVPNSNFNGQLAATREWPQASTSAPAKDDVSVVSGVGRPSLDQADVNRQLAHLEALLAWLEKEPNRNNMCGV